MNVHGRKVGPSPETPGHPGPLGPPITSGCHGSSGPPGPLDPRTPWDLRASGTLGNYLYRLKFRI